jgi:hypothetical protein
MRELAETSADIINRPAACGGFPTTDTTERMVDGS